MKDIYYVMKDISEKMNVEIVELDTLLFSYGRVYGDEIIIKCAREKRKQRNEETPNARVFGS